MLTLSFTTGILDAATYLGLHGVFTANMTGNLIFIGLGITGEATVPVLRAVLALGGFAVGAAAAGRLLRSTSERPVVDWRVRTSILFVALELAGLMGENRLTGRKADRDLTARRVLAVATMGVGAVVGALLMHVSVEIAIAVPAVLTFCVAGVLTVRGRRSITSDTSVRHAKQDADTRAQG